uniref:Ubiquitin-like domain-containing protein n=1 Tax=Lotharella globosa TaxID=91324 RepID=A0A7S3YZ65_9EUKA
MSEIEVKVVKPDGSSFSLRCNTQHMMRSVKRQIFTIEKIPFTDQKLYYKEKLLPDLKTIQELEITDGATIKLVNESVGDGDKEEEDLQKEREELVPVPKTDEEKQAYMRKLIINDQKGVTMLMEQLARYHIWKV